MSFISKLTLHFRNKPWDFLILLIFLVAIIKLFSMYFSAGIDDGDWDDFKLQHHCKMQLKKNGVAHTVWECDDGNLYYRWRQQR